MSILYRNCMRLAGSRPAWFEHPNTSKYWQEKTADRLFTATWRADRGAAFQAHQSDIARVAIMARLLRSDMTPAAAIEYLDL